MVRLWKGGRTGMQNEELEKCVWWVRRDIVTFKAGARDGVNGIPGQDTTAFLGTSTEISSGTTWD